MGTTCRMTSRSEMAMLSVIAAAIECRNTARCV
jgi:hypothetical protein